MSVSPVIFPSSFKVGYSTLRYAATTFLLQYSYSRHLRAGGRRLFVDAGADAAPAVPEAAVGAADLRVVPKFDVQPTFTSELWICRADGQGMREIGYILTYPDKVSNVEDYFGNVQWLPNGKQISFVYHGTIYVVPADPGSGGGSEVRM